MNRALFVTLCALFAVVATASEDVVVGTKDNFNDIIGKEDLTLVKFFAPWCGHCKKMAGDFKEAATELKGKAVLVDLDATVEKDLAAQYEIKGFPTLKLFSKGEVISDYKGGRTKDAIVQYIERALEAPFTEIADADGLAAFTKENEGKALLLGSGLDKLASAFKSVSMSLRDVIPDAIAFGSASDASLLENLGSDGVAADSIILIRDDGSKVTFTGEPSELEAWTKMGALPLFGELNRDTAGLYTELDKPVFILFQDPDNKDEKVNKAIEKIGQKFRAEGRIAFTWINSVELKSFQDHVGVGDMNPAIAIYEFKGDIKYVFDKEYSPEVLTTFISDFLEGKLEPTTKSQPIPEKNDEPVKVVVGDSWEDIVEDESKDVLIEQYAPWCGHCKKLAPVLDELAADLKNVATLVIAKMDATLNDAPADYKAQGYPTLHFFPAGSKKGIAYSAGREKEDFVKFFQENCTHKEGIELPVAEEVADEDGDEDVEDADEEGDEDEKEEL